MPRTPRQTSRTQMLATVTPNGNGSAAPVAPPRLGERTKRQASRTGGVGGPIQLVWDAVSSRCNVSGLTPAPAARYSTYRAMRQNPTIAIARMAATAPIKAVNWSFETIEGAPAGALELIQSILDDDILRLTVREMLRAYDYGNQPFEIVWETDGGMFIPRKLKPLLPDKTTVYVDKAHGRFVGMKNDGVELGVTESLLFTYDDEAGGMYGRSRNENIREHIWPKWIDANKRLREFAMRVANPIPVVRYTDDEGRDAAGATRSGFELAKAALKNLADGIGIVVPAQLSTFAEELIRAGANVEDIWSWQITFLEMKTAHGADLISHQASIDKELVRGWLVTERSILEGEHGTKAEAEAHIDFVLLDAEDTAKDIALCLNWHLIDKVLALNYGEDSRGSVRLIASPLVDEKQAFVKEVVKNLLTNPSTLASVAAVIDADAMFDQAGVPKLKNAGPIKVLPPLALPPGIGSPGFPQQPAPQPDADLPPLEPGQIETTQTSVLNGAQVTAATAIVVAVAAGEIPRDAGIGQLEVLFNLTSEQAERIMGSAGTRTPTTPNPKPNVSADDPDPARQELTNKVLSIMNGTAKRMKMLAEAT